MFAHWSAQFLVGLLSSNVYNESGVFLDLSVDFRMLVFTATVAILITLLFGLAPAWRATHVDPQSAMKANARCAMQGGKFGLGKALVVGQIALSLVLVVGAGLLLSTFFRLETLNPGFDRDGVLMAQVDLGRTRTPPNSDVTLFAQMLNRFRTLPGIHSVSSSEITPLAGMLAANYLHFGDHASKNKEKTLVYVNEVSDGYFQTLGIRLLAGRNFHAADTPHSPRVAIVNQALSEEFFAGRNPVGKYYRPEEGNGLGDPVEIIGLVENTKYADLRENFHPTAYVAASQNAKPGQFTTFELRAAAGKAAALIPEVKSAIAAIDHDASFQFKTLAVQVDQSLARERLLAILSGFFGGLALLLATVGLYGVTSYGVTRRRNEIGIRMALGAQQSRVLRAVLGEVVTLTGVGLAIGFAATVGATRFIASFLYGVKANDPRTLCLAAAMLALVALIAGFIPARRASHVDPMEALREE